VHSFKPNQIFHYTVTSLRCPYPSSRHSAKATQLPT